MVIQGDGSKVVKFAFRTDASIKMGTGHVMRCLTLADALRARGHQCHFVMREQPGEQGQLVMKRGHQVHMLSSLGVKLQTTDWLGCDWQMDIQHSRSVIQELRPDWLIVDHYGIDVDWERAMATICEQRFIIDDLANREHDCTMLLDQNLGRYAEDYDGLVGNNTELLIGPEYALLRPQFREVRARSLKRRLDAGQGGNLINVMISMGGIDQDNMTDEVLQLLSASELPENCRIEVILGTKSPWIEEVRERAENMACFTEVLVGVDDMAARMAQAHLAIGGAGSTSWERCCLGLPSLIFVLAENQQGIAKALHRTGAAICVTGRKRSELGANMKAVIGDLVRHPYRLTKMSVKAKVIVDGYGTDRIVGKLAGA